MTQHDVFVCHAPEDQPIADRVCAVLEQEGIPCWIAPRDGPADHDLGDSAVLEAIASSRLLVLVFSHDADASVHIPLELEAAVARSIPIVPVRVEEVTPSGSLQHTLEGAHWLDALAPPIDDHLHHVAGYVRALLDRDDHSAVPVAVAAADAATVAPSPSPYGPAPGVTPGGGSPPGDLPLTPAALYGPASPGPAPAPPEGRGSGLRWVLIALGALVLVLVGAAVTFAVLRSTDVDSARETQSGTGTEAEGGTGTDEPLAGDDGADPDPKEILAERSCELLDPADVTEVYGVGADTGTPVSDGYCDFADAGSITIFEEPAGAGSLGLYRDVTPGEVTDLPDLGGGAFIDEDGLLFVLDEGSGALLLLITYDNSPTGREQLIDLAELIVAE